MKDLTKKVENELSSRWHSKMPRFFYWIVVIACGVLGTAFAINSGVPALGGTLDEWWTEWYGRIISGCITAICVCKFTVAGGYKDIDPDKVLQGENLLKRDAEQPNMSDVETEQPNN